MLILANLWYLSVIGILVGIAVIVPLIVFLINKLADKNMKDDDPEPLRRPQGQRPQGQRPVARPAQPSQPAQQQVRPAQPTAPRRRVDANGNPLPDRPRPLNQQRQNQSK